jgi:hypothetical protein
MERFIGNTFGSMRSFLVIMIVCFVAVMMKVLGWDDGLPLLAMAPLVADKKLEYKEGVEVPVPVKTLTEIFAGSFLCVDATGWGVPGGDTAGQIFQGISRTYVPSTSGNGAASAIARRRGLILATFATPISQANVGDNAFLVDDQTVDLIGNVTNGIFAGVIAEYVDTTHAFVDIEPAIKQADVATHVADVAGAHAASAVSLLDSGNFTAQTDDEGALQEIYQSLKSAKGIIDIPTPAFGAAGVALAAFSSEDAVSCGYCVTAKGMGIRWNNHATPGPAVAGKVLVPPDADVTANMVLHILAAKTGATVGDATKFTVAAYNNVVGAAYDADNTFGGDTDAMVGNATAKNVQHLTLTLALADLAAYPAGVELTIKPKDGTLGTDDVIMLKAWVEYKKKLLTA